MGSKNHSGYGAVLVRVGANANPQKFNSVLDAEAEAKRRSQGGNAEFVIYEPTKRIVSSVDTIKLSNDD